MVDQVKPTFDKLKRSFATQKTKSYEWRMTQLDSLQKGLEDLKDEIVAATVKDLGRDEFLSYLAEVLSC